MYLCLGFFLTTGPDALELRCGRGSVRPLGRSGMASSEASSSVATALSVLRNPRAFTRWTSAEEVSKEPATASRFVGVKLASCMPVGYWISRYSKYLRGQHFDGI
ncbi:hypothetical protein Nepgr_021165 [Nepenthes gracilis]|uniref:Uncharacterized protein n=1 Tax=Nepenthes gracilis TaxID=150966 RepID=A0AAD3SZ21_NEPGR|nr:hypothetical protein Nepgr_021165 [Nepenthes gracilis]